MDAYTHILFLALNGLVAALVLLAALSQWLRSLRQADPGWGIRLAACLAVLSTGAAWVVMARVLPTEPLELPSPLLRFMATMSLAALVVALGAPRARTGLIMAAVHGLMSLGLLIFLALLVQAPSFRSPDPANLAYGWEVKRLAEYGGLAAGGYMLLMVIVLTTRVSRGTIFHLFWGLAMGGLLVAQITMWGLHPSLVGASLGLAMVLPLACGIWLLMVRRRSRNPTPPRASWALATAALPVFMATIAIFMGLGDSAREAARVSLMGLEFTPSLVVPFLFAFALGRILGQEDLPYRSLFALGLTLVMAALLVAQKEVGNVVVIMLVAAVTFILSRGAAGRVAAGAGLGLVAAILAYQLGPLLSFIPFTVQERITMWMGGADLLRRGGHLVLANHMAFDVGGFWGLGLLQPANINLPRIVTSIDTDFPLAVLGLVGGLPLMLIYVTLVTSLGVLIYDSVRRLPFLGSEALSRRQAPLLAALGSAILASSFINLSGAFTQLLPFAAVPTLFASYGFMFQIGTYAVIAVFFASATATHALRPIVPVEGQAMETIRVGEASAKTSLRLILSPQALWMRARFFFRRFKHLLRFRVIDTGVHIACGFTLLLGVVNGYRLVERYTDQNLVHVHPTLSSSMILRPDPKEGGVWHLVEGGGEPRRLREGDEIQVDSLILRHRESSLSVVGYCFPQEQMAQGVSIGFQGMLQGPRLPWIAQALAPLERRLGSDKSEALPNDVIWPFGDIALHHLRIRRQPEGTFVVERLSPKAELDILDKDGKIRSANPTAPQALEVGESLAIGTAPRRIFAVSDQGEESCLLLRDGHLFTYSLSPVGPTIIGGLAMLRSRLGRFSADFEFAEKIKRACEDGIIQSEGPEGPLKVIPHDEEARAAWAERTRKLFFGVFTMRGEALLFNRGFYRDGGRRFQPDKELDAFLIQGQDVLGLRDSFRFVTLLPDGRPPVNLAHHGLLLDSKGRPLVKLDAHHRQIESLAPLAAPLVGYAFPNRGIYGGLVRSLQTLIGGYPAWRDPLAQLNDLLAKKAPDPWGYDVETTLDRDIIALVGQVLQDETAKLNRMERGRIHHASAVVLGRNNDILAAVNVPTFDPNSLEQVLAEKAGQRRSPMAHRDMAAFHHQASMGSTVKIGLAIQALRRPDALVEGKGGPYLRADHDGAYGRKHMFYDRGGVLASFRGKRIAPIHNYGGKGYGGPISLRKMLILSINTAASYLSLVLGRDSLKDLYKELDILDTTELLPEALRPKGKLGYMVSRYRGDPLSIAPIDWEILGPGEVWNNTFTARLALSGFSAYPIAKLALIGSVPARDGVYHRPRIIKGVRYRETGERIEWPHGEGKVILPPKEGKLLKGYLVDVVQLGTARSIRQVVPKEMALEIGGKTGTGETTLKVNRRPRTAHGSSHTQTMDHKVFVGFWPANSDNPYVVATIFERVSHLDTRIAIRTVGRIVAGIAELEHQGAKSPTSGLNRDPKASALAAHP